jgi:hypothetical protein
MEAPPGLIALRDAADEVGRALYRTSWCPLSEAFLPERRQEGIFEIEVSATEIAREVILLKRNPEIEHVITTIAERAESGELACSYFSASGWESLDPSEWRRQFWRDYFVAGKIDLFLPGRCTFEIFVERRDLKRLIATLSKPVTEQPELVTTQPEVIAKPTEQSQPEQQPEEKQQTSAAEETALGNPASPEQQKVEPEQQQQVEPNETYEKQGSLSSNNVKSRKQPKRDIIKEELKVLFPPDGKPDQKLPTNIVMKRIKDRLKDQGREDVPVTRDTLLRVLGRRK